MSYTQVCVTTNTESVMLRQWTSNQTNRYTSLPTFLRLVGALRENWGQFCLLKTLVVKCLYTLKEGVTKI